MLLEYLHSEWVMLQEKKGQGGLSRVQVLSSAPSPDRLQHVRRGHRDLALWVLEHDEVEPRTQVGPVLVRMGGWARVPVDLVYLGAPCQLLRPQGVQALTQQVDFWALPSRND